MRPEDDGVVGAVGNRAKILADEGRDAGLTGTMVEGSWRAVVDAGDSLEGFMADGQEAGCTGSIEDDIKSL